MLNYIRADESDWGRIRQRPGEADDGWIGKKFEDIPQAGDVNLWETDPAAPEAKHPVDIPEWEVNTEASAGVGGDGCQFLPVAVDRQQPEKGGLDGKETQE